MKKSIPSEHPELTMKPSVSSQPFKQSMLGRANEKRKLVLTFLALLGILLLGAGLLTLLQLVGTDQSLFQRASEANQVNLAMTPAAITLAPNQEATISLTAGVTALQMSAADIQLDFNPGYLTVLAIEPSNPFSVILRAPSINAQTGKASFAVGTPPNATLNQSGTIATVKVKAGSISGTTALSYDTSSQVAVFGSNTNRSLITGRSSITVVTSGDPDPTDSLYQLSMSYRLDGVNREGIQIPTEISLRYKVGEDERVKTYPNRMFTSTAPNNHLTIVATPLDQDFDLEGITGDIEVLIKPEAGLRTIVGTLPTSEASRQGSVISANYTQQVLRIGDVHQSGGNINRITLLDISEIVRILDGGVNVPVSSSTRRADLNHDGVISIIDLSALLTHFTSTTVRGEEL